MKKRIGEEFHGIISNMIGYEVGSSPVMVYTTAKTSSEANFKHNEKKRKKHKHMVVNIATLLPREFS